MVVEQIVQHNKWDNNIHAEEEKHSDSPGHLSGFTVALIVSL